VYRKYGIVIIIFKIQKIFVKAHLERAACMANIFHFAVGAVKLVNATFFILILDIWVVLFHGQVFSDGVDDGI